MEMSCTAGNCRRNSAVVAAVVGSGSNSVRS